MSQERVVVTVRDTETARTHRGMRLGFLADGIFKLATALAISVLALVTGSAFGAGLWSVFVAASVLVLCGAIEIAFSRRGDVRAHVGYLAAYDAGWFAATVAALVLAQRDAASAGELWFAYQAIGAAALGMLLAYRLEKPGRR